VLDVHGLEANYMSRALECLRLATATTFSACGVRGENGHTVRIVRDPHRTVYGYDRKNYGYLRVLTGRNRNRIHPLVALYGTVTVTVRLLRPYTVV
jgi:hypothetical protein